MPETMAETKKRKGIKKEESDWELDRKLRERAGESEVTMREEALRHERELAKIQAISTISKEALFAAAPADRAADAERDVERDGAGRDRADVEGLPAAEAHDRALAVLALDLQQRALSSACYLILWNRFLSM
jgi:hypothetical protein